MHTDSGMTGISLSGFMPYMTVASLEMSDEPDKQLNNKTTKQLNHILVMHHYQSFCRFILVVG